LKKAQDELEAVNVELKSLAKRIKDKDRKVAALETQITDLEEERFLTGERHKEELSSK
jgi:predicted  nucleic acid-binding Zn-ribbon protein